MSKTLMSILFSVVFLVFIAVPIIISLIDKDVDVSMSYNIAEEENNQEIFNIFNFECNEYLTLNCVLDPSESDNFFIFYLNTYSQLTLENSSPPPKYII